MLKFLKRNVLHPIPDGSCAAVEYGRGYQTVTRSGLFYKFEFVLSLIPVASFPLLSV